MIYYKLPEPAPIVRNIVLEEQYLKTSNSPPTMQPYNPQDNSNKNLFTAVENDHANPGIISEATNWFKKIMFVFGILIVVIIIFFVFAVGSASKAMKNDSKGDGKHHYIRDGIMIAIGVWIIKRIFGDEINREFKHLKGDHSNCHHDWQNNQQQGWDNQQGYPPNNQQQGYPPNNQQQGWDNNERQDNWEEPRNNNRRKR